MYQLNSTYQIKVNCDDNTNQMETIGGSRPSFDCCQRPSVQDLELFIKKLQSSLNVFKIQFLAFIHQYIIVLFSTFQNFNRKHGRKLTSFVFTSTLIMLSFLIPRYRGSRFSFPGKFS